MGQHATHTAVCTAVCTSVCYVCTYNGCVLDTCVSVPYRGAGGGSSSASNLAWTQEPDEGFVTQVPSTPRLHASQAGMR